MSVDIQTTWGVHAVRMVRRNSWECRADRSHLWIEVHCADRGCRRRLLWQTEAVCSQRLGRACVRAVCPLLLLLSLLVVVTVHRMQRMFYVTMCLMCGYMKFTHMCMFGNYFAQMRLCTYMCINAYMPLRVCMLHMFLAHNLCMDTCTYSHMFLCMSMHVSMHAYMYACVCVYLSIHLYT